MINSSMHMTETNGLDLLRNQRQKYAQILENPNIGNNSLILKYQVPSAFIDP